MPKSDKELRAWEKKLEKRALQLKQQEVVIMKREKTIAEKERRMKQLESRLESDRKDLSRDKKMLMQQRKAGGKAVKRSSDAGHKGVSSAKYAKLAAELEKAKHDANHYNKEAKKNYQIILDQQTRIKVLERQVKNLKKKGKGKKDDRQLRNMKKELRWMKKRIRALLIELAKKRRWFQRVVKQFKSDRHNWARKQQDALKDKRVMIRYVFLDDVKQVRVYREGKPGSDKFLNRARFVMRDRPGGRGDRGGKGGRDPKAGGKDRKGRDGKGGKDKGSGGGGSIGAGELLVKDIEIVYVTAEDDDYEDGAGSGSGSDDGGDDAGVDGKGKKGKKGKKRKKKKKGEPETDEEAAQEEDDLEEYLAKLFPHEFADYKTSERAGKDGDLEFADPDEEIEKFLAEVESEPDTDEEEEAAAAAKKAKGKGKKGKGKKGKKGKGKKGGDGDDDDEDDDDGKGGKKRKRKGKGKGDDDAKDGDEDGDADSDEDTDDEDEEDSDDELLGLGDTKDAEELKEQIAELAKEAEQKNDDLNRIRFLILRAGLPGGAKEVASGEAEIPDVAAAVAGDDYNADGEDDDEAGGRPIDAFWMAGYLGLGPLSEQGASADAAGTTASGGDADADADADAVKDADAAGVVAEGGPSALEALQACVESQEALEEVFGGIEDRQKRLVQVLDSWNFDFDSNPIKQQNDDFNALFMKLSRDALQSRTAYMRLLASVEGYIKELRGRVGDLNSLNDVFYNKEGTYTSPEERKSAIELALQTVGERHTEICEDFEKIGDAAGDVDGSNPAVQLAAGLRVRDAIVANNEKWNSEFTVTDGDWQTASEQQSALIDRLSSFLQEIKSLPTVSLAKEETAEAEAPADEEDVKEDESEEKEASDEEDSEE